MSSPTACRCAFASAAPSPSSSSYPISGYAALPSPVSAGRAHAARSARLPFAPSASPAGGAGSVRDTSPSRPHTSGRAAPSAHTPTAATAGESPPSSEASFRACTETAYQLPACSALMARMVTPSATWMACVGAAPGAPPCAYAYTATS